MNTFFSLLLIAFSVAALSTTLTRGKIFKRQRLAIKKKSEWLYNLLSCPYCTSHWVAFFAVGFLPATVLFPVYDNVVADKFVFLFATIAVSAIIIGTILQLIHFAPDDATDYKAKAEFIQQQMDESEVEWRNQLNYVESELQRERVKAHEKIEQLKEALRKAKEHIETLAQH